MTKVEMIAAVKNGFQFITLEGDLMRVLSYDPIRDRFDTLKTHPTTRTLAPQARLRKSYEDLVRAYRNGL